MKETLMHEAISVSVKAVDDSEESAGRFQLLVGENERVCAFKCDGRAFTCDLSPDGNDAILNATMEFFAKIALIAFAHGKMK